MSKKKTGINEVIEVFEPNSDEFAALQAFANRLNAHGGPVKHVVEIVYWDYGQRWKWTTLIAHGTRSAVPLNSSYSRSLHTSWQALSPRNQEIVIYGSEQEKADLEDELLSFGRKMMET